MLCQAFGVSRRTYYHAKNTKKYNYKEGVLTELEKLVIQIFADNRRVYGARKISVYIKRYHNRGVSKNTVRKIMKEHGLISVYNLFPKFKRGRVNNSSEFNLLNRQFSDWKLRTAIVSDLTYIDVRGKWMYLCAITDLCNREIIGASRIRPYLKILE